MVKLIYASVLSFVLLCSGFITADVLDRMAVYFKNGDSQQIAAIFAPAVDLAILDQEDNYTRAQAEQVLKDFFRDNTPQKVNIVHRTSTSRNYRFMVLKLFTNKGIYRVAVTFKAAGNTLNITELRIELSKD